MQIYIKSEFIIPNDGRTMPAYHLVMQLYDKEGYEMAKKVRAKKYNPDNAIRRFGEYNNIKSCITEKQYEIAILALS